MSARDQQLADLRHVGHCHIDVFSAGDRYLSTEAAIAAARARAYRMAKKLGVRVETAMGWNTLYVKVVR